MSVDGGHRIGEFARRVGVAPELLRAWEQRYGLLRPERSPGGFRLYGEDDAERVARMRRALDDGLSAAEAARVALASGPAPDRLLEDARARVISAIESYDEAEVQAALDDALAAFGTAGRLAGHLPVPRLLVTQMRAWLLCALVRLGEHRARGAGARRPQ